VAALVLAAALPARANGPRFLPDDPLAVDDDRLPMPKPAPVELSTRWESSSAASPGGRTAPSRARST
jgi:hypothetical protein